MQAPDVYHAGDRTHNETDHVGSKGAPRCELLDILGGMERDRLPDSARREPHTGMLPAPAVPEPAQASATR